MLLNTKTPDPVSSVTVEIKLALVGVPNQVATPVPKDVIPVPPLATGSVPVTFVAALTKVVYVVPVPPLAMAKVPATVTAPLVAVDGVNPVLPNVILETLALTVDGLIN